MAVHYILGRAGMGKTHYVLNQINSRIKNNGYNKLILLVPEQFTLQAERDLIESQKLPGIMRAEVLSFTRLAYKVFSEVGGLNKVFINEQGKQMILRNIIDENIASLELYKKAAKQRGFVSNLNEFISDLKKYDIDPMDIKVQGELLDNNSVLAGKLRDVGYIYELFSKYLTQGYIDTEDKINLLVDKMEEASWLHGSEIWIDGFSTFTPQTLRVLEKLMLVAEHVYITFTLDFNGRDKDLFKLSEKTFETIRSLARVNNRQEAIINLNQNEVDRNIVTEIRHLERELYAYPYKRFSNSATNIELFAGVSLYTEVEKVASKIIALVRDKGYRWRDIGVVSNSMDSYSMLIKRVFAEYGIPYFLDEKRSVMNNPIIELILSALEIICKGYTYEEIIRYAKTGFSTLTISEYEELENYMLQYGIKREKWKQEFVIDSENRYDFEQLNNSRKKLIEPLERLEKRVKGKKRIIEITEALYDFLESIAIHSQLESWIEQLRSQDKFEYVSENTQIWNIVMEMLDQLVEFLGEQKVTLKEYVRILESGFLGVEIGIIPTTNDQVLVGNIQRSKSHAIKALFVVGVNDGILPSGRQQEGILSDDEKLLLKERQLVLGNDSEISSQEEKFLIYSAFSKPSEYLWVSYAMGDQEGKALRPSILIDRLKKIFPKLEVKSDLVKSPETQLSLVATPDSTFKHLIDNLRSYIDGEQLDELWWQVYAWYYRQSRWTSRRKSVLDGLFYTNDSGYISNSTATKLYDKPVTLSISRLESFIRCPFSHFIKYGLRPKERKTFDIDSPDIGEMFHWTIETFFKEMVSQNLDWHELNQNQCSQMLEAVVDNIIPNYGKGVFLSTNRYRYLVQRLKRITGRALWTLTEHIKSGAFLPLEHEVSFGLNKNYPPIMVELSNGEVVYLEGRIDRVDIFDNGQQTYLKIIDYKSGNKDLNLSDVYHGLQLQLMVYLDAVLSNQDRFAKNQLVPAGTFYFRIQDPLVQTESEIKEEVEDLIRKKLKMKGLVLNEVEIIKAMDMDITEHSNILPVRLKKDGSISNSVSSAINSSDFSNLIKHVRILIKEIAEEIFKGNIKISPYKSGKQTGCDYCELHSVCKFDTIFSDNHFRNLQKLEKDQVLDRIKETGEVVEHASMDR